MTRVLVTGASTPVGRGLVRALAQDPRVECVLSVAPPGEPPIEVEGGDRIVPVTANLTRSRDVRSLVFGAAREHRIDVIAHLASHRPARDGGRRVHAQNVEATRGLLDLAERHPTIRRFVLRSHAEVYRIRHDQPTILLEDHPLELSIRAPQWVRDRVEADLVACTRIGQSRLEIAVLRCAECPAPANGSQLWDYLDSPVCFTALGFDPMLNVLSVPDAVAAMQAAIFARGQGVWNAAGRDTLPLSAAIRLAGRVCFPLPGPLLLPLYGLRAATRGADFRYDLNYWRFHFGGVMDAERARRDLGFVPRHPVHWRKLLSAARLSD
jgi:UDP-glucose 4-epimerase